MRSGRAPTCRGPRTRGARRLDTGTWSGGWWSRARRVPSPHENERPANADVDLVLLHSISLPPGCYGGDEIERLFTGRLDADAHPYFAGLRDLKVSAHFVIRRDGEVLQFVDVSRRAWHAGASSWRGREACNDFSVGIELEGLEGLAFEASQYEALVPLLCALRRRLPIAQIAGHEHVAPGRKGDPGAGFDWHRLASRLAWPREAIPFASPRRS